MLQKYYDIISDFYKGVCWINGWKYTDVIEKERGLELKAFSDEFVFKYLPDDEQKIATNRAKVEKDKLPPSIFYYIDLPESQERVKTITILLNAADDIEEFYHLMENFYADKEERSLKRKKEEHSDFDKILIGIMNVPKEGQTKK